MLWKKLEFKSKYCVYDESRVLRFLFLNSNYGKLFLKIFSFFTITYLIQFLSTGIEHCHYLSGHNLGFIQDFAHPVKMLVITISLMLSKAFLDKIPLTFLGSENQLNRHSGLPKVIVFNDNYEADYVKEMGIALDTVEAKTKSGKEGLLIIYLLCIGLLFIFYLYMPFFAAKYISWNFSPKQFPLSYFTSLIQDCLIYLIIFPPLLWRIIASAVIIYTKLKTLTASGKIRYIPMSPDKAGGLRPIGSLALSMTYIVACPFIFLIALVLTPGIGFNLGMLIIFPSYLLFVIAVFFMPLSGAHGAMRRAKEAELNQISNEFNLLHEKFSHIIGAQEDSNDEKEKIYSQLIHLYDLYSRANKMPVWPLDFGIITRFLTIIMIPLIYFIVNILAAVEGFSTETKEGFEIFKILLHWIHFSH